ncbi:hypothetical protein [Victivallis sp. Marseille-Q1083]|uniref:hypothetical protein n=1 Tax=Victivallis sp. Marseille-Q1083 TaxID=2717288 RepID=UPI00158CC14C|nr:hypothetical protein [Victivallis sp. Marseille-Q1083]
MLWGKIIVAIVFGALSFLGWKNIWNGLVHQKISPLKVNRGGPHFILRQDGELHFWARFYEVLGITVLTTCMLLMILSSYVAQWSYLKIILLKAGMIGYCLGAIAPLPYQVTVPIIACRNKDINKTIKFFLIIIREILEFVFVAGQIALGIYCLLYVKE